MGEMDEMEVMNIGVSVCLSVRLPLRVGRAATQRRDVLCSLLCCCIPLPS